jgi:hypothetical protein
MPRPYTKYACEYRCHFSNRSAHKTVLHEMTCLHNPAKRSCLSCRHDRGLCGDENGGPWRECRIGKLPEQGVDDAIGYTAHYGRTKPKINCRWWETKRGAA